MLALPVDPVCSTFEKMLYLPGTPVAACFTTRDTGDMRALGGTAEAPPWLSDLAGRCTRVFLSRQVHGATVALVEETADGVSVRTISFSRQGERGMPHVAQGSLPDADALVASGPGKCLGVRTADCIPVALGSEEGVFAAVHAGWRGLCAGVVEHAAEVMASLGATRILAAAGASIGPCCYEFGPAELDMAAWSLGEAVRSTTTNGRPALDLRHGFQVACDRAGVEVAWCSDQCTSCGNRWWSHRARRDVERQGVLVWAGDQR